MKKIIGLMLMLAFILTASSIHVIAASPEGFIAEDMPAFYLDANTGQPVELQEEYESGISHGYYYADCMQVTHIEPIDDDYVRVRVQPYPLGWYGGAYEFTAYVGDWCVSDVAAVIMYDNKTPNIIDDSVVCAKYITYIGGTWG